ncbi:hypothetical protein NKH77_24080 [Streptomyces sp. M19]
MKDAAAKLKDAGVKIPYGLPLGPEESQAESMMWMLSAGGGITDSNGSYTLDSPENIKAFEWLRDDLVVPGLTGSDAPRAPTARTSSTPSSAATSACSTATPP